MKLTDAIAGTPVIINTSADHWFDADKRKYMSYFTRQRGQALHVFEIARVTKGGLIEVWVTPKHKVAFAPQNVDVWEVNSNEAIIKATENFIFLFQRHFSKLGNA